jgi:radical SAM superfamily enzyme YgiQ (UPF0313 family)
MTWLAGVLVAEGYTDIGTLDFYSAECVTTGIDAPRVAASLNDEPADVYLFSPMTPNLPFALEIAALAKSLHPRCRTIFGGVAATPLADQVAAHPAVDFVVRGRGEYALPRLLDALTGRCELSSVGNLTTKHPVQGIVSSAATYPWMPVADIPFPKVDLFDSDTGLDLRYLRQVYSLGCPYRCSFCTIQTIGRRASYFPIERVLAEIRAYRSHYGEHHNIYFGDETFTVSRERTRQLCDALTEDGTIHYDCQTRLNLLGDEGLLDTMRVSGCRWVEVGVESMNQATQNRFKQKLALHDVTETLKRVQGAGLPVCSFVVNGFPDQSVDDMRRSIDAIAELVGAGLLQATYLFGLVPYPGSALYESPGEHGMELVHHDFRLYNEDWLPVYRTKYAEPEETYEAFLYGLDVLGDAMGTMPYFGRLPSDGDDYGSFWQASHV